MLATKKVVHHLNLIKLWRPNSECFLGHPKALLLWRFPPFIVYCCECKQEEQERIAKRIEKRQEKHSLERDKEYIRSLQSNESTKKGYLPDIFSWAAPMLSKGVESSKSKERRKSESSDDNDSLSSDDSDVKEVSISRLEILTFPG